jgi:hypothetical protein
MLLKIRACGKNEPENEAGHVIENTVVPQNVTPQFSSQAWNGLSPIENPGKDLPAPLARIPAAWQPPVREFDL